MWGQGDEGAAPITVTPAKSVPGLAKDEAGLRNKKR